MPGRSTTALSHLKTSSMRYTLLIVILLLLSSVWIGGVLILVRVQKMTSSRTKADLCCVKRAILQISKYIHHTWTRSALYPNGPRPLPFLGNIISLSKIARGGDAELLRIAARDGDLGMFWLGTKPIAIVNSPQTVKDLLDRVRELVFS